MPDTDSGSLQVPRSTQHLLRMTLAFQHARLLLNAMELGVFAELARGPRTLERLHAALPGLGDGLLELLEALVVAGLLGREGNDHRAVYANTRDSARLMGAAFPSADVLVLGCGPGLQQAATLQQLIRWISGTESVGGVLVILDCTHEDSGADSHPVRTLQQWCRDAGFADTQIVPLVAPVCAVFASR
jgi:hypothetical protein